jgi:hypothetical protein
MLAFCKSLNESAVCIPAQYDHLLMSLNRIVEKIEKDIAYIEKIRALLKGKDGGWTKILSDPEFIKGGLDIVKTLAGSFRLSHQSNSADYEKTPVFVEIIGEMKEKTYSDYLQYKHRKNQLPRSTASLRSCSIWAIPAFLTLNAPFLNPCIYECASELSRKVKESAILVIWEGKNSAITDSVQDTAYF